MLLRIDGTNDNPTQRLILALQERGSSLSKEEDFYLSLIDNEGVSQQSPKDFFRPSIELPVTVLREEGCDDDGMEADNEGARADGQDPLWRSEPRGIGARD